MTEHTTISHEVPAVRSSSDYEPPALVKLGDVVELTLSGNCCDTADRGSYYY